MPDKRRAHSAKRNICTIAVFKFNNKIGNKFYLHICIFFSAQYNKIKS